MSKEKQIRLSFGQKRQIVCLLDDGVSHSNIAKQFGVKRQAIGYIAKDPDKFKDALDSGMVTSSGKSLKQSQTYQDADTMLLQWFLNMRNQNKVINGHLLVASFKRILERQGHDFPSEGACSSWIQRWRNRHRVKFVGTHGESLDCPDFSEWLEYIQPVLVDFQRQDIWNADESALFYRMQESHTFAAENEEVHGGKVDKARVTILVTVSAAGEKFPLLCIGKSKNPRWPVVMGKKANPPVDYDSSRKGWMTEVVWARYINAFNNRMKMRNRSALLFVDNCSAHKYSSELSHTHIMKLPVNTTSKLQPCDQGVIRSMKAKYRDRLANFMLTADKTKDVNLYNGLMMLQAAWAEVTEEVVLNAWRKSGIFLEELIGEDVEVHKELENDLDLVEDQTLVAAPEETNIDLLIDNYQNEEFLDESDDAEEREEGNAKEVSNENIDDVKTSAECLEFLKHITNKFISVGEEPPIEIANLEDRIRQLPQVQSKITEFFTKSDNLPID